MNTSLLLRALALLLAGSLPTATAASLRWAPAGGSQQWSDGGNWRDSLNMTGQFPNGAMFDALIPGSNTLVLSTAITIGNLSFSTGPTGTTTLNGGGQTLTVVGSTFADNLVGPQFTQGTFILGTLDIYGGVTVSTGALASAAETNLGVSIADTGTLTLSNGGQFTSTGTFSVIGDSGVTAGTGGGTFVNSGDFTKVSGTLISTVGTTFRDMGAGTISNTAIGTLAFSGSAELTDSLLAVSGGGNIHLSGSSILTDIEVSLTTGGDLVFTAGSHLLSGVLTSTGDGTGEVRMTGSAMSTHVPSEAATLDFAATAPFAFEGSRLSAVDNVGTFLWRGGALDGVANDAVPGRFIVTVATAGAPRVLDFDGLTNRGTITHAGASVQLGSGSLTNTATGTYDVTGSSGGFPRPAAARAPS